MRKYNTPEESASLKAVNRKVFKSIDEDIFSPYRKKHSPVRSKLSKKEDIAFIRARKFKTYRKIIELDKMIDRDTIWPDNKKGKP